MSHQIKRVPQRDWDNGDCGIACVAMVARVPYFIALAEFRKLKGKETTNDFRTRHHHLVKMLDSLGVSARLRRFWSLRAIETSAIVKVNETASGDWHWVVLDCSRLNAVIHDPKPGKNFLIRDFRGLKGNGQYILVAHLV